MACFIVPGAEAVVTTVIAKVLKKMNYTNIKACLLTYKNDYSFKDLFYETLEELKVKKLVFAGRVNAGKSSLINKLFFLLYLQSSFSKIDAFLIQQLLQ